MDRIRLDSSFLQVTTAQDAYDKALRAVADAVAQAAGDAAAAARLQAAEAELARARLRVDSARVTLDANRLAELATLQTSDQLLGTIAGNEVLALFPVGVEAKLDAGRLRVRVWPDAMSTSTHDPRLTPQEVDAAKRYWRAEASANSDDEVRAAWHVLADEIGMTRAAWAARALTPTNRDALAPGVEPIFPTPSMQDDAAPFVPRAGVLPDRWMAVGIKDNARVVSHLGGPIPMDLAVGLDTTPSETAALTNREGEPIQLPPRMRWMTDFAVAVQAGMALDIALAADVDRLDALFIIGVRVTQTPAQSAEAVSDLITGHRFSRGFAFVPQDTPTNNSSAGGSGLPSGVARIDSAFLVERRPREFVSGAVANGVAAAHAFGLAPDVFACLSDAGAAAEIGAEPKGFEQEAAGAMQTALWQVTIGAALEDFLLLPESRAGAVREFFRQHVRAAGPVPAVRVGRQPYGVLPVTTIDGFVAAPEEGVDPRLVPLLRAARTWFAMLRQPAVFEGSAESALRFLGRSAHLFAETTTQNSMAVGDNRWQALAGSLARASGNTIRDTWRNGRVRGTVESLPQPVTRPIVDETTVAAIATLATALPKAILGTPEPSSVLGRMLRQAALLEWSRFARAVCEATLDEPSLDDLATKSMLGGSDVYIGAVVNAMTELPTHPVPPVSGGGVLTRARRIDDDGSGPAEPPDPDEPPPPPPPPPPAGEPAINPQERQAIRAAVGTLAAPLASCPGAARLASFRAALAQLARFPAGQLEGEMFRALDVSNHRIDAWFTALASRRLATVRASNPQGLVIGGWGCLLDVRRADAAKPQQRAEFIHAPSLDQAAAAAVLRSGARRAQSGGSAHADIDLSSRRVRLARWILEGVRNGRSLADLLGSRFERAVKGTPAEGRLGELRAAFPGFSGQGVLDGLRLHTERPPASDADVDRCLSTVDETVDAVADALTAESVYQIVRGNPVGALLDIEALAGGAAPPPLRVTETPPSGIRLTHRLAIAVPAGTPAPGWPASASPRARAEPLLDPWCGFVLGPADAIELIVDGASGASVNVPLSSLRIGAIDVVLSGRGKGGELAELVVRAAAAVAPTLADASVRITRAWTDLVGLCGAMARVMTRGDVLRADAFAPPSAMPAAAVEAAGDLPQRVAAAAAELTALRDALLSRRDAGASVATAAAFGIRVPGALLGATPTNEQQDALLAAVESRLEGARTGIPRDRLRALFGGDLPGIVAFTVDDAAPLRTTTAASSTSLLGGDSLAPIAWLDAVGRNHPKAAALGEVVLRRESMPNAGAAPIVVAQVPWNEGDRWIATAFTTASRTEPDGRLSVLIHAPAGVPAGAPIGGLLVDAWTDTIPAAMRDTAMALRFNNASTRAPQSILLAVSPDPSQAWTTETLVNILQETIGLARLRMLPPPMFSQGGLMPFVWLGQRAGAGISFAV